jgi:hypothetical protein
MAKDREPTDLEIMLYCWVRYGLMLNPATMQFNTPSQFRAPSINYKARNLSQAEALDFVIEASLFGVLKLRNLKKILRYDLATQQVVLPSANTKVSVQGDTINGIRFHQLKTWSASRAPIPVKPASSDYMVALDSRLVVMLYELTKALRRRYDKLQTIYHAGFHTGAHDCHGQGRAMDFSGVKIDGKNYFVPFHWGSQPVQLPSGERRPQWPDQFSNTSFRLNQTSGLKADLDPQTSRDIFQLAYTVFATHATDTSPLPSNAPPSRIGGNSFIMHPDHPTSSPGKKNGREAHNNHVHVQIGKTAWD